MNRQRMLTASLVAAAVVAVAGSSAILVSCARNPSAPPVAAPSATTTPAPSATSTPAPSATPTTVPSTPPVTTKPPATTVTTPPGPPPVPAALRGKDVEVIPTSSRVVALTFDAGANADGLASILATLDSQNVTGTFFLTGSFARNYPQSVRAIVAGGHRIGNHTSTHPHLPALSDSQVLAELTKAESQIDAAGGTDPRPLFRFPFGDRTPHTIAVVNGAGYVAVRWSVDTLGWKGTKLGGITAQIVVDRVVAGAKPGEIVLMHVGSNPDDHTTLDADALPTVIARLRDLGYRFVTLDALLATS